MKRYFLIAILTVLTTNVGHAADDIVVDGVVYEWYANSVTHEYGYIATGWDEETPIQSLHICGEVNENQVYGIAAQAFEDNKDIVYLTIDEGITSIGQNAFCRCQNLKVVILPEGLKTIEEEAFAFCTSLTTMVIPSTVTEIQAHAFSGCTGVTDVYFLMTDEDVIKKSGSDGFHWWDGVYTQPGEAEHGGMEFNTNQNTVVHVPAGTYDIYNQSGKLEAWLSKMEDDDSYPLWWIVNYGVVDRTYTVADNVAALYVDVKGGLYAKDDSHWLTPDLIYPGETDYMKSTGLMIALGNHYDQSNWVVLTGIENPGSFKGNNIEGKTITGTLRDKKNPVIEVSSSPQKIADSPASYQPNVYIPASFMGRTQHGVNGKTYAFVRPKPQELIDVEWAIYGGDDRFYLPEPDDKLNVMELAGGIAACYDLYEGGEDGVPELEEGGTYAFKAINRRIDNNALQRSPSKLKDDITTMVPYIDGGVSDTFIVYPLELPDAPLPTAVTSIVAGSESAVKYYSIDGRYMGTHEPLLKGLYITSDGRKILKR